MENYGLDLHGEMLLEEYRQQLPLYKRLMEVMKSKTAEIINEGELTVASMEFRIKEEASLAGKLQRKGSKYGTLRDITDIFGGRIIMYYNEDVDRVASFVESKLEIDWPNSVDKRKMHEVDSFGYNSLHYICRIPKTFFYDPEYPDLNDIRFEIQMRTLLQHAWANMDHDTGYKSGVEIPKRYLRNMSRLAGMLELVDDEFSKIRIELTDYRRKVQSLVRSGNLDEVPLDGDTFRSYLELEPFSQLNKRIAAMNQAEIQDVSILPYLAVFKGIGLKTLGDIGLTDLDIISSSIGPQDLCIAYILKNGGGKAGIRHMFDLLNGESESNDMMAEMLLEQSKGLPFMNK